MFFSGTLLILLLVILCIGIRRIFQYIDEEDAIEKDDIAERLSSRGGRYTWLDPEGTGIQG